MTHLLRFVHWQERANEVQPEEAHANRTGGMDMEPLSPVRREDARQAALVEGDVGEKYSREDEEEH